MDEEEYLMVDKIWVDEATRAGDELILINKINAWLAKVRLKRERLVVFLALEERKVFKGKK